MKDYNNDFHTEGYFTATFQNIPYEMAILPNLDYIGFHYYTTITLRDKYSFVV